MVVSRQVSNAKLSPVLIKYIDSLWNPCVDPYHLEVSQLPKLIRVNNEQTSKILIFKKHLSLPKEASSLFSTLSYAWCPRFRRPKIFLCKLCKKSCSEVICEGSLLWYGVEFLLCSDDKFCNLRKLWVCLISLQVELAIVSEYLTSLLNLAQACLELDLETQSSAFQLML